MADIDTAKWTADATYIVAGDLMQQLMARLYPQLRSLPFCEDLSRGSYTGDIIDNAFICQRALFLGVDQTYYRDKIAPIMHLDKRRNYILCFGEDACCQANLAFLLRYLRAIGYTKPIRVRIVDELTLQILREYQA